MTSSKASLNISIDKDVKEITAGILSDMGLDHTTAIEMFYRRIISERRLPFQPTEAEAYGKQLLDIIKQKNIPHKTVEVNAEGHILVDKDNDPELYDWAVNG